MVQLENIEAIETRLWRAADLMRSNSELASNEYFMPVMGLIFLRHAYSRFLSVKPDIIAGLPSRGGVTRPLKKEDFSQKGSIFLRPTAQFDYFIDKSRDPKLPQIIIQAMESIEEDYENLKGVLPKQEYQSIPPELLGDLVRTLNPDEPKTVSGDVFGRIYEYFLTQFADQIAHDGGEFFTPISLVSFIANVLEPEHGTVFDPACGSGGMFVQSAEVLDGLLRIGFVHHQQIIWDKERTVLTRTHYWFQHEPCWYVRMKNAAWYGKAGENSTIWASPSPKFIMGGSEEAKFDHPTQKPVALMRRPILNHTKRGELVYDPFLGSGTTLAAAEATQRVCCGLELDPKYADVVIQRWQQLSGKKATLEGDGRTFDDIAQDRVRKAE